jgi:hypothetical protein
MITKAADCIAQAGGFVRAVDCGTERDVTETEMLMLKELLREKDKVTSKPENPVVS